MESAGLQRIVSSIFELHSFERVPSPEYGRNMVLLKYNYFTFDLICWHSIGSNLGKWRIPGVLQRFAVSYFVVATVSLWMSPGEEKEDVCLCNYFHSNIFSL